MHSKDESFSTFINFNGDCGEALEFYAKVFDAQIGAKMTYGQMPQNPEDPMPAEFADKIMYSALKIAGSVVMFSDVPPGTDHVTGTNVILNIRSADESDIKKWYNGLQAGGEVITELGPTFFAKQYAMVADKFGLCWNLLLQEGDFPMEASFNI